LSTKVNDSKAAVKDLDALLVGILEGTDGAKVTSAESALFDKQDKDTYINTLSLIKPIENVA